MTIQHTESYDVVVLGTGAAGLVAALAAAQSGARVGLFEKGDLIGGTTALSSGVAWIPANQRAGEAGIADSAEQGLRYLDSLSHGKILPKLAEAFVHTGPELVEWLDSSTPLKLRLVPGFPDYHPEKPGGKPSGGRSLEPDLFSFECLPGWEHRIVGVTRPMLVAETPIGGGTGVLDPEVGQQRHERKLEGLGRAMVGALLRGCLDQGISPMAGSPARELVFERGRVCGVRFDSPVSPAEVRAGSVVIATGGFEFDSALVRDFLRGPMSMPPGVPTNTGDGLRMAMQTGAMLGNMSEAWWVPVVALPEKHPDGRPVVSLVLRERTLPRSIMVNSRGVRFTNEAANYNALGGAFHQLDPTCFDYVNQPCWLVFDHEYVRSYGGFGVPPGGPAADWIVRAPSLAELAKRVGIDSEGLTETVQRWNRLVSSGRDADFGRGESAYDGWCGDRAAYPGRAATLGPLDAAPYYAVPIVASALGTKGGPRTTVDGEVLDVRGAAIPGLFAAGNVMAGPTGMVYGGAGGTLGPALVFGYRAGRRAAVASRGRPVWSHESEEETWESSTERSS